jgi:phage antirepressor YoqD-like protein
VNVKSTLDVFELRLEEFRKHLEIIIDWPILGEPEYVEIGETTIENGLFKVHTKDIIVNNKHFVVQLM